MTNTTQEIKIMPTEVGRTWLPIVYADNELRFAYPAFRGTHQEAFTQINADPELRPAEGLELALLVHGAYNGKDEQWQEIRNSAFQANYTRAPIRNLWLPSGSFSQDKSLSGVLVERDVKGIGLSKKMKIPNIESFKKNEHGVYVSPNDKLSFVPADMYKLGEHDAESFAKDKYAITLFSSEGAEIFAKTAVDSGKTPWIWGIDVAGISGPEQRVTLLGEDTGRLVLDGDDWDGDRDDLAFGVRK